MSDFSTIRLTTGSHALMVIGLVWSAGTSWESREAKIPSGFQPSVIALDGPLLLQAHPTVFAAMLNPFSFAPHSTTVAELD